VRDDLNTRVFLRPCVFRLVAGPLRQRLCFRGIAQSAGNEVNWQGRLARSAEWRGDCPPIGSRHVRLSTIFRETERVARCVHRLNTAFPSNRNRSIAFNRPTDWLNRFRFRRIRCLRPATRRNSIMAASFYVAQSYYTGVHEARPLSRNSVDSCRRFCAVARDNPRAATRETPQRGRRGRGGKR